MSKLANCEAFNVEHTEARADAGIIFIGPKPRTMRSLGDKVLARHIAVAADVPVIPASESWPDDEDAIGRLRVDEVV